MNVIIKEVEIKTSYKDYKDAYAHMINQEVKDLGWMNDHKTKIPDEAAFTYVYSNRSGSSCLYVDRIRRIMYSVDMGD